MPLLLSAIANAGRHGVLVKSAVVMERLGDTTTVAFDKTGTLTGGAPRVAEFRVLASAGLSGPDMLRFAAAAEQASEHPLGRAVVAAAHDRGLNLPCVEEFSSAPGRGVSALVEGRRVMVGSPAYLAVAQATATVAKMEAAGHTAVVVVIDGSPAGVIGLADQLRPAAQQTVTELTTLTGTQVASWKITPRACRRPLRSTDTPWRMVIR